MMAQEPQRVVFDAQAGLMLVRLGHHCVHGTPEQLEALAACLISALYEVRKGMHEAPPLPASTWRLKDIADG